VGLLSLALGVTPIAASDIPTILLTEAGERVDRLVVWTVRLPRFLLALLAGAALGLVGVMLQNALNNPLAEPGLLGVSAGASLVVAVVVVFNVGTPLGLLPWLALAGGLGAGLLILFATQLARDPLQTVLVGAALSALLGALITIVIVLGSPDEIQRLYVFLVGSLTGSDWDDVQLVLPWLALGIPAALCLMRPLNLLQLGDEMAASLGLPVLRMRALILLLSAAMIAAVVAACGPIGFVALLAPHMARRLLQTSDARQVLPAAGLLGAVLLAGSDLLARELFRPAELPVGLITTVVGAPLALFLLRRTLDQKRQEPA
jgi:iron complex transport system permease protein